jgi:acetylornithine deacetylase/succinyl-diaminopimelate desuccinylase-like protein
MTNPSTDAAFTLSSEQERWIQQAHAHIDPGALGRLLADMVDIPSPPGDERALAEFLAGHMAQHGLTSACQRIDERAANAVGRYAGRGRGGDLLLYAPIDAAFTDEDARWFGGGDRRDLRPLASMEDGFVIGLGAENPKGYAACVVAAAEAVARAGLPLCGDLVVGLGAGGMPTNAPAGSTRDRVGQGVGCAFMLEQGVRTVFAVIAKPNWTVSWEEVGLCWFRVTVGGALNYTGIRHVMPYRNPIVAAARVIDALERWFPDYAKANTAGLLAPQGSIGAIEAGWPHKPAFVPAEAHLYIDLRINARTDPTDAKRQFGEAIARIREAHPDIALSWEMILAIPGSRTDPDNWIIKSTTRAWEAVEGRPHIAEGNKSGATDANILRQWGIPTARIGMPRPAGTPPFAGQFSMGVASVESMAALAKLLVRVIVDTCTRPRAELGLGG